MVHGRLRAWVAGLLVLLAVGVVSGLSGAETPEPAWVNGVGPTISGTAPTLVNGDGAGEDGLSEGTAVPAPADSSQSPRRLPRRVEGPVYVIPVEGTIDQGLAVFVRRALQEAREGDAVAVLVEINTFGGRVDAATDIKDALGQADLPVVAFVTQRAWSAGALIALGSPFIAMAPGSSMGAAEPRPADEKTISALRKEFEAAAERYGRDPRLAAAMVDARVAVEGVVEAGEILTLSAHQARDLHFVDFVGVRRAEVMDAFGVTATRWVEAEMNWAERIARLLTDPYVSSILLTLGFLGLLSEVTSPGWGVPGTAGLVSLALFFGARLIAGLAGLELVLLFALGLVLIGLEIFIIPGFGLAGLGGIAALLASVFFAFPDAASAINALAISLAATVVLFLLLLRFFPRSRAWRHLVLETKLEDPDQDERWRAVHEGGESVLTPGRVGKAVTPLRPAGSIEVEGQRFDAVTEGGYIAAGEAVRIVQVEGRRIVVRKLAE